jgi:hypothetical protein
VVNKKILKCSFKIRTCGEMAKKAKCSRGNERYKRQTMKKTEEEFKEGTNGK